MDADRFDALTRTLTGEARSRRAVLKGLAGSAVAALAAALGFGDAEATHYGCRHVGRGCIHDGQCCSSRCRGPAGQQTCRSHHTGGCAPDGSYCTTGARCGSGAAGYCWRTTGGAAFCGTAGVCATCTKDSQCTVVTGPGSACVTEIGSCFGCGGTVCAAPA
jgi:hypothetical protein